MRSVAYTGGMPADVLFARLTDAAPGLKGAEGEARGAITLALVDPVETINSRITEIEERIGEVFVSHPDRVVFASLPRSGTVRAANLLAEIRDCRQKFPTDAALAALAGVSPSTRQSGKRGQTVFRWACNKKLRFAVIDFANGSRVDPWAADVYRRAIAGLPSHPRCAHPRPGLDPDHLALLARRRRARAQPPGSPSTHRGLDIGHFYVRQGLIGGCSRSRQTRRAR